VLRAERHGSPDQRQQQHDAEQQHPTLERGEPWHPQHPQDPGGEHQGKHGVVKLHPDAARQRG
jgi:hypothetical protein